MVLEITTELKCHEDVLFRLSARCKSPMVVGLHGGAVMLSSRQHPDAVQTSTLFPDHEHSCEPRRHVRFAALSQNALPYAGSIRPKRQAKSSPKKHKRHSSSPPRQEEPFTVPLSASVQALRKKISGQQRSYKRKIGEDTRLDIDEDGPESRQLWGFSVHYSPKKQRNAQWRATDELHMRDERAKQEQEVRLRSAAVHLELEAKTNAADYAQYLYLTSLYGPLDGLLYCCCSPGYHGRVYMLLVDASARRLQRWASKRIVAMRRYWIGHLAQETSRTSLVEGIKMVVSSFHKHRHAVALLQKLRLIRAARALRAWYNYSVRMIYLREKMRFALVKDVESRFQQWRKHIEERKKFKCQLKIIARRKAMQSAFEQWQLWRKQQEKLRCHLVQRWMQTQRECWKKWCGFIRYKRAGKIVQRSWRLYSVRKQRDLSVRLIQRVYRGWHGRKRVQWICEKMDIHRALLRLLSAAAWKAGCEIAIQQRHVLLEKSLLVARCEAEHVILAEIEAVTFVELELSKVLRNEMHRKLEEYLQLVKEDDSVLPSQAARNNSKLQEIATRRLIDEQRFQARREATTKLRTVDKPQHQYLSPCIICQAYVESSPDEQTEELRLFGRHTCLGESGVSISDCSDPFAGIESWENIARTELTRLEQQEKENMACLGDAEPPTSLLWRSVIDHENDKRVGR